VKGIILAGGAGSRLHPLTLATNKHLLPVFDKPLIFYPLTTLMLAGIREILIIVNPNDLIQYKRLLLDGRQWGVQISYQIQENPGGIPQGITIGEKFIGDDNFTLILGDNIFYGVGLGRSIAELVEKVETNLYDAVVFTYKVSDPQRYGVLSLSPDGVFVSIEEKPTDSKSDLAVTGLYVFNNNAINNASKLIKSGRGEFEITDLIRNYALDNRLLVKNLNLGTAWLDTGTFSSMNDASNFIRIVQERQNIKIGDPSGAATVQGWLGKSVD
jgi:glucose-1-phosphate thymidylyltransferase